MRTFVRDRSHRFNKESEHTKVRTTHVRTQQGYNIEATGVVHWYIISAVIPFSEDRS